MSAFDPKQTFSDDGAPVAARATGRDPLYLVHTRILEAFESALPVDNPLLLPIPGILFSLVVAHLIARHAEPWTRARIVALAASHRGFQAARPAA